MIGERPRLARHWLVREGAGSAGDGPPEAASAGWPVPVLVGVATVGFAVRLAIMLGPLGRPDADEVLAGLMARHIGDDGFPIFFWGQHYGGTIEVLPVALSMRLFGTSVFAMRVPTLVLAIVNSLLLWRVARRLLPERGAQMAAALMWLGAPAAVWLSVREQLFYPPSVLLGLLVALFALRARDDGGLGDWVGLGLAAGLGWWTSPNVSYFAVPAAVVLLWRPDLRAQAGAYARGGAVAVAAALIGMAPWLRDNLETGGLSFQAGATFPSIGTYPERLGHLFTHGLPAVLGFREMFTYRWIAGPVGIVGYLGVLALLGFALRRAIAGVRARGLPWDAAGFVSFALVFAAIPFVMDDPNVRYLFFVVPFVAVLVARVASARRAAYVALAMTVVVTGVGLQRLYVVSEVETTGFRVGNVGDLGPVIEVLDREHIDAVYGDYWVAYRIAFESGERIVATPSWGLDRYPPYTEHVRGAERVAWVVQSGNQADALLSALTHLDVSTEVHSTGEFAVVIPARPVRPDELPDAARHPIVVAEG